MNYCGEIRGLVAEANKIHAAGVAHGQLKLGQLYNRAAELQRQAAREFAALNGWRWSERQFSHQTLASGGTHDGLTYPCLFDHRLFDHPLFFRGIVRPYRAMAIVGQPYNTKPDEARALAAELSLALHVPPNLTASWHCPDSTRFFCLTRPEITAGAIFARAIGGDGEAARQ